MHFLKLTDLCGNAVFVNMGMIVVMRVYRSSRTESGETTVLFGLDPEGAEIHVKESCEEILKKL